MDSTLLLGFAVIALGTGVGAIMLFGQRANPLAKSSHVPGTIPVEPTSEAARLTSPSGQRGRRAQGLGAAVPRGLRSSDVHVRWYQRVRSGLMLVLITVGIGMAVGAVIGAGALAVSLLLG